MSEKKTKIREYIQLEITDVTNFNEELHKTVTRKIKEVATSLIGTFDARFISDANSDLFALMKWFDPQE